MAAATINAFDDPNTYDPALLTKPLASAQPNSVNPIQPMQLPGAVIPNPTNLIPTNPDGSQVGGGTPWATGASTPGGAPAGYTWDPNMAMFTASPGTSAVGAQAPGATSASTMPAGIDPALAAIYQGSGLTPGDRGTGFADWQYWQGVGPSQYARLAADIAGKGSDQPTGTPGTGIWSQSGGGASGGSVGGFSVPSATTVPDNGSVLTNGALTPQSNALLDLLMSRAKQSEVVDPNDPIIKAQTDAYNASQVRNERNYESGLAEKGGANANLTAEQRIGAENVGQNESAFQAQLMGQELTARRTEIAQALQGASGLLTAEQALQLQEELKKLDQQIQQSQFAQSQGQQESQFGRTLAENAYTFDTQQQFLNSPLGS